jgi:hypothetical protein
MTPARRSPAAASTASAERRHLARRCATALGVLVQADLDEHVELAPGPDRTGGQRRDEPQAVARLDHRRVRRDARCLVGLQAADEVPPDAGHLGGLLACLLVAALAEALDAEVAQHGDVGDGVELRHGDQADLRAVATGVGAGRGEPVLQRLQAVGELVGAGHTRTSPPWRPVVRSRR